MALEIELKLALPPNQRQALLQHPLLGKPLRRVQMESRYFDTPGLDLLRHGVGVRWRREGRRHLQAVKTAESAPGGLAQRREWESPRSPRALGFDFSVVDDAALQARLHSAAPDLHEIFLTRFGRDIWQLAYGDSLIEVACDIGQVVCGPSKHPICELELELLRGTVSDLFALALDLQQTLPLRPMLENKAERGYALLLGLAPKPRKAKAVGLQPEMDAIDAFRAIALECLGQLQANEAGLGRSEAPEFVHQARVALRRLRSALHVFAPVLPAGFLAAAKPGWQAVAQMLGEVRDWDVLRESFIPALAGIVLPETSANLSKLAGQSSLAARAALGELVGDESYARWLQQFSAALFDLPASGVTLAGFAAKRLRRQGRQLAREVRARQNASDAARHQLRIHFKRLRYTLDFFAALLPLTVLKPCLAVLTEVQDALGAYNDHVTALGLLEAAGALPMADPAFAQWMMRRRHVLRAGVSRVLRGWLAAQSASGIGGIRIADAPSKAEFR